jgi:hypothetical protein
MSIYDLSAYEVLEDREISDVKSNGYILKHKKSGARIAILSNEDDNKVFYIGFKTTPQDETGVPHIIEHTVLCGSEKFPLKDPFVELVKGSLNTFLNAMTYPDKTVYPVASCNDRDFKNLMAVYMDAVFHPNITKYEEIFKQEGWHYELESEDAPLTINGVVYNEMKGAYSSPEEVLQNQIFKSLFPDNTYSRDSGGNPVHIPELTYEDYLAFYRKYYHPANSYIYLYGDMDIEERLDWMDREYLGKYDRISVESDIAMQQPFDAACEVTSDYSIASDDPEEDQTYLAYNRVIGTSTDPVLYQAFDILDYALVSAPGAPVRQALIDAGIGDDVSGSFDSGIMQPVFTIMAKNANPSDREQFVTIIEDTLRRLVKEGIDRDSILAGINSSEFRFREADFGQLPKGLLFGLNCLDSWLFDDKKPFIHLECLDTFAFLREKADTGYFEQLVQEYLLDNTHGSTVMIVPKKNKNTEEEEALKRHLAEYKASLSADELHKLVEDTKKLRAYQEEPDTEENRKKIPLLGREDMKKEAMPFSNTEASLDGIRVVRHEVETNGIDYVNLMFEARDIPEEEIAYLGYLAAVLGFVDTKNYGYAALSNAINIYTGGITTGVSTYPNAKKQNELEVKYEVKVKVLEENLTQAMDLVGEILLSSKLSDVKRLTEITAQTKARLQASLSGAGHIVASIRAMSYFSKYAVCQDALHGEKFYQVICEIEKQLADDPQKVIDKLQSLTEKLFAQNRLIVSFTSNGESYQQAVPALRKCLLALKRESEVGAPAEFSFKKKNEGFTDASQIQYVARAGSFAKAGFSYHGALRVLRMIMEYDYMWTNIRVKGGAYGCMAAFLRTGETYFVSYRDPNLEKTNEVYEGIPQYLRDFDPDERDMTKYIIGTFSSLDTPLNPEAKGARSMAAYLEDLTYEDVQRERDEILSAQASDIQKFADMVQAVLDQQNICVVGNENRIREAAGMFGKIEKLYS